MDIFRAVGTAVITAMLALVLRSVRPELAMQTAMAGGIAVLLMAAGELAGVYPKLRETLAELGAGSELLMPSVRVIGIAYMTGIGAELCRDAGENALAMKTEICGRVMLLSAALPVLASFISVLKGMADSLP